MTDVLELSTDVLVIGGGPAGAWAALRAAKAGADVVLVDKGYCGTSGATAPAGTGVWYVAPEAQARASAKASRERLGGNLADHDWMDRVLDQTYANMHRLGSEGRYPFPVSKRTGEAIRTGVQGPEYMRRMRAWVQRRGVTILDHSPVLQLLTDRDGRVAGPPDINDSPAATSGSPRAQWFWRPAAARSCPAPSAPTSTPVTVR